MRDSFGNDYQVANGGLPYQCSLFLSNHRRSSGRDAEVHDCYAPVELIIYEDLGFCKKGEGKYFIEEGRSSLEGDLPVNVNGGLESCGNPVGATGIRMIYEITRHLQGKAGERQVKNAKIGLAHNIGGPWAITSLTILGAQ